MSLDSQKYKTRTNIEMAIALLTNKKIHTENGIVSKNRKYYRFPKLMKFRGDLKTFINLELTAHILNVEKFITKDTKFFTMGSCFANNISEALVNKGYKSSHMPLNESINTTFANKYLIDYLSKSSVDSTFNERVELIRDREETDLAGLKLHRYETAQARPRCNPDCFP
jgi:hypothetical protein